MVLYVLKLAVGKIEFSNRNEYKVIYINYNVIITSQVISLISIYTLVVLMTVPLFYMAVV